MRSEICFKNKFIHYFLLSLFYLLFFSILLCKKHNFYEKISKKFSNKLLDFTTKCLDSRVETLPAQAARSI